MSSYLVVYNICEIKEKNVNWYKKCISNLLKLNYKKFHILISGCRVTEETKQQLLREFSHSKKISYYFTDHFIAVNVTFNRAVEYAVKTYGEFDGYIYIDSGVDIEDNIEILNEIEARFKTDKYGMISVQTDIDHGHYWFMSQEQIQKDPYIRNEDFTIPIGKCVHLHFQCFHNDLLKAYGRLLPDIFVAYCTESILTFLNAAINKQWIILKDIILKHDKGIDGATLSYDHTGPRQNHWDNLYGAFSIKPILDSKEFKECGMGYEELWVTTYRHDKTKFTPEGFAKNEKLKHFIKDNFFLKDDRLDYNFLLDQFIPVTN